jgi:DNA-binding GntR family transcriptional regulator
MASIGKLQTLRVPTVEASPTLHEEIVDEIRERILEGKLLPGRPIAEIKLCTELGISRTPLREALKVLASENLVKLVQHRGAVVTDISVDEIAELFEIMEPLEELVGRLAAERMDDADRAAIETMHQTMTLHHRAGRRQEYFDLNQAIHLRFAELSGNFTLFTAYANFARKIRRARYLANLSDARWADSVREHEAFMAALHGKDPNAFAGLLREHLRKTGEVVCTALRNADAANKTQPRKTRDRTLLREGT